jgi:hypothetical protein
VQARGGEGLLLLGVLVGQGQLLLLLLLARLLGSLLFLLLGL